MLHSAALLLALLAQDPPAPAPAPPPAKPSAAAAEQLAELLRPCKEARGIEAEVHMVGELPPTGGEGNEAAPLRVADVLISLRFARPCHGRLDMKGRMLEPEREGQDGAPAYRPVESSLIGTGEGLFLVEHRERSYRRVAGQVSELGDDWPGLLPLQVWAGIPPTSEFAVTALAEPPQPGWRGFAVEQPWLRMEYWFDADGGFRSASLRADAELQAILLEQGKPRIPEFRMEVSSWKLHREAAPEAFSAQLPAGFVDQSAAREGGAEIGHDESGGLNPPPAGPKEQG